MKVISSLCCLPLSLFALPRSTDPSRAVFMWTSDPKVNIHAQRSHLALPHLVCLVPLSPPPRATRWTPWRRRSCPKKSILSRVMTSPVPRSSATAFSFGPTRLDAIMVLAALCFLFCLRRQCRHSSHRLLPQQHTVTFHRFITLPEINKNHQFRGSGSG